MTNDSRKKIDTSINGKNYSQVWVNIKVLDEDFFYHSGKNL